MDIDLRYITEEHYIPFIKAIRRGFGGHSSEETIVSFSRMLKHGRSLAAFDGKDIVGGSIVYPRQMNTSEDGEVLTAVVSDVAVQPTHRRRGILTRMMEAHLRESYDRGESVAILGASESVIYGRYGFGIASHDERWTIDRRHAAFAHSPPSLGRLRFVERGDTKDAFPEIAARACARRPGFVSIRGVFWDELLADKERQAGSSAPFFVTYEEEGRTDGYVIYRIQGRTVIVLDFMAVSEAAHAALWQFVFGIDLRTTIESGKRPVDDPLPWMLADPRRLERTPLDGMWLRVLNVPKALEARTYAVEGRIVFEVLDEFCPWNAGRYELEAGSDGARCKPTTAPPHITLPAASLASIYLGGVELSALALASRAQATTREAMYLADDMFRTRLKPWWPHEF